MIKKASQSDTPPTPVVVIITGLPATGKTTIARRIAERFSLPLMTKDTIKELLFDTLWEARAQSKDRARSPDRAWSKKLGHASIELLFRFLEAQLAAGQSCVVESNFAAEYHTARFLELRTHYEFEPLQINCVTEGETLFERFRRRTERQERHPGHCDHLLCQELRPQLLRGRSEPLAIGGRLVEVDTTDFEAVDYAALFADIELALHAGALVLGATLREADPE